MPKRHRCSALESPLTTRMRHSGAMPGDLHRVADLGRHLHLCATLSWSQADFEDLSRLRPRSNGDGNPPSVFGMVSV
jgi:hypothetical protein